MTDQDNLRNRIARVIHDVNERLRSDNGLRYSPLEYDQLPDRHRENRESIAQAIIDELGLTVVEAPGGISDYSPFTGKPVVQPDKWWVEGERVFTREKQ